VVTIPVCSLVFVSLVWPLLFLFFMSPLPSLTFWLSWSNMSSITLQSVEVMSPYAFICGLHTCRHVNAKDVEVICSRHNTIFSLPWFSPPIPQLVYVKINGRSELLCKKLTFYTVTSLEAVMNILWEICQYKGTENRLFRNISCPLTYHTYLNYVVFVQVPRNPVPLKGKIYGVIAF